MPCYFKKKVVMEKIFFMGTEVNNKKNSIKTKGVVFGLMVMALGFVLILRNTGMLPPAAAQIIFAWPMVFVAVGFISIFSSGSRLFGFIFIALGAFFLLPDILDITFSLTTTFWPLFIIFGGLLIVFFNYRMFPRFWSRNVRVSATDDIIEDVHIFSGSERIMKSDKFRGGETVNIFGGATYDLTGSHLSSGENVIEIVCVFGGVKIIVPEGWQVKTQVTAVMGGFEDKRFLSNATEADGKILIIKGACVFGGGQILSR